MKAYGPLTERQAQVLQLLAWGYDLDETATALGIAGWTAKNHLVRAARSLGTTDRGRTVTVLTAINLLPQVTLTPPSKVRGLSDLEVHPT